MLFNHSVAKAAALISLGAFAAAPSQRPGSSHFAVFRVEIKLLRKKHGNRSD
jgi:hypothetical protein